MKWRDRNQEGKESVAAVLHWDGLTYEELVDEGLCTLKEAWEFLGIGRSALYNMMRDGELPYVVLLSGVRRIPKVALKRHAAERIVVERKGA